MVNEIKSSDAKLMSCSSIAMLQERFRQLEKMKEMRQERELLKLISVSSSSNNHQQFPLVTSSTNLYDQPSSHMFFHSEIIFPTRRLPSFDSQLLSLSLWPNTKPSSSWLSDAPTARTSVVIKNTLLDETSHLTACEVDTTLHL
uniref:Uncharacterized protein n=1 Tax=Tanacetum cinerariifolium TaxID=118510 RepID=A0A699KV65_TANCI|nr:hypothetical protein [Tanacetum cinerariifolium]